MAARCTLYFFGHPSDFYPGPTPDSETLPTNRLPYIFITISPQCVLPADVCVGQNCRLPIRLESAKPSAKGPSHTLEISGKIYCPYDTSIYDPAGYDFTGHFDTIGNYGSLEFTYRQMLSEEPPRPNLEKLYKGRRSLGEGSSYNQGMSPPIFLKQKQDSMFLD